MKWLGSAPDVTSAPTAYNLSEPADAAPFDSVPGIGFDANPAAAAIVPPPGVVTGSGSALAVDPAQNNAFRAINRAWRQGAAVQFAAGRYLISGLAAAAQDDLAATLALRAERVNPLPPGSVRPLQPPRIGIYQPWTSSIDEGWTRWLFERYGFPIVTLHPEDFGLPLASRVDVIVMADDAYLPIAGGLPFGPKGRGPVRPEYAYALTEADLTAFEQFILDGGTLIAVNSASTFAIEQFGLPVRNVVGPIRSESFFLRGSVVQVTTDTTHPIMAGMPDQAAVFVDDPPVFDMLEAFRGRVLARYASTGSPLLSGYLIGDRHLQGRAAALDVELGKGRVILLGFKPEWRGQPFGTFRVLFNAALNVR
jgi:hypothetical protein